MDRGRLPGRRRDAVLEDDEADVEGLALDGRLGGLRIGDDLCPAAGKDRDGERQQQGELPRATRRRDGSSSGPPRVRDEAVRPDRPIYTAGGDGSRADRGARP